MIFASKLDRAHGWHKKAGRGVFLILLMVMALPSTVGALPARLVLALDGIAYRDLQALQEGVIFTNFWGKEWHCQAFSAAEGYFPVSRMISTFPSTSDVAWTDIFGGRPLPGYQRTYFSTAANSEISINGITTSTEREAQMDWDLRSAFLRSMGYIYPVHMFQHEVNALVENFFHAGEDRTNYYAYIRSSDDAEHMQRNVMALLCQLDRQLQESRARYKAQAGHDLQIVILSDHGHNHAGPGKRIAIRAFLEKAGYRITESITGPKDVVLPTAGIESWVEIHNSPAETEKLAGLLCHLQGVDVLAATVPDQTNCFLVMNAKGERAGIQWNPVNNSFRYSPGPGDPINYRPVVEALARNHQLDADGFATADDWMAATLTNRYPLAPERIVRGLTRVTLNPATILISLDNHYVNAGWLVQRGSRLVSVGSTHGALDDLNSDGILLSNFTPTKDTSSGRVAAQFDGFPGVVNYRAKQNDAEWITKEEQALTRIARVPFDRDFSRLPDNEVCLRIWSPQFSRLDPTVPVEVAIKKIPSFSSAPISRGDPPSPDETGLHLTLKLPLSFPNQSSCERVYALPPDLILEKQAEYKISGWIQDQTKTIRLFAFEFHTGSDGRPAAF